MRICYQKNRLLGHIIGRARTKLDPKNVKVVIKFPIPRTITNVQTFFGFNKVLQ